MKNEQSEKREYESPLGPLVRLFWVLLGNAILAFCAVSIAQSDPGFGTAADAIFWTTVGCLMAARYVDIRYLGGYTAYGEPATMAHWRRYSVILAVISAAVWALVHAVARFGG